MRDGDGDGTPAGRRAVRPPAVPRVTRDDVSTRHTPSRLVARVSVTVRRVGHRRLGRVVLERATSGCGDWRGYKANVGWGRLRFATR